MPITSTYSPNLFNCLRFYLAEITLLTLRCLAYLILIVTPGYFLYPFNRSTTTTIDMICIFQTFWLNGTGGLADLGVARPQRHVDLGGLQPRTTITSAPTSRDLN